MKPKNLLFIIVFIFFFFANIPTGAHTHAYNDFLHHSNSTLCFFDANDNLYTIDSDSAAIEYLSVSHEPILPDFFSGLMSEPESYHFILRAPPLS
jgi:hypothetical protein